MGFPKKREKKEERMNELGGAWAVDGSTREIGRLDQNRPEQDGTGRDGIIEK